MAAAAIFFKRQYAVRQSDENAMKRSLKRLIVASKYPASSSTMYEMPIGSWTVRIFLPRATFFQGVIDDWWIFAVLLLRDLGYSTQ